jgi:hypothetical protein
MNSAKLEQQKYLHKIEELAIRKALEKAELELVSVKMDALEMARILAVSDDDGVSVIGMMMEAKYGPK